MNWDLAVGIMLIGLSAILLLTALRWHIAYEGVESFVLALIGVAAFGFGVGVLA
jgi:hypothetical protein